MTRVFKAVEKFVIEGKGIAVMGLPFPEAAGCTLVKGTEIEIRSPGLAIVKTRLAGFELMRNCWSPHKPRVMCVLLNVGDFELPEDAELWIEETGLARPVE
ncbi:MAG TPA: hypothetical protein VGE29_13455 [Prosthecobacter sp.]